MFSFSIHSAASNAAVRMKLFDSCVRVEVRVDLCRNFSLCAGFALTARLLSVCPHHRPVRPSLQKRYNETVSPPNGSLQFVRLLFVRRARNIWTRQIMDMPVSYFDVDFEFWSCIFSHSLVPCWNRGSAWNHANYSLKGVFTLFPFLGYYVCAVIGTLPTHPLLSSPLQRSESITENPAKNETLRHN